MKRMEIIANRSVEAEIIEALESAVADFCYTILPRIQGKGKAGYRLGTAIWPELNFYLISCLGDEDAGKARSAVATVKERFPREGIKLFVTEVREWVG